MGRFSYSFGLCVEFWLLGRFLVEIWLSGGFLAFGSIFGTVTAIGSISGRDLGFGSNFRFFGVCFGFLVDFWYSFVF